MAAAELKTVQNLDLKRYMGRWYEIACMPSRFQPSDSTNTRATYTLLPSSVVGVKNETYSHGKWSGIEGKAWKVDPASPDAKFKVQFWVPPFLPVYPARGNYWVMALGQEYEYAVVGEPNLKYMWVLSRSPFMDDTVYAKLLEQAKEQGYDVSKLKKTEHRSDVKDNDSAKDAAGGDKGWWWLRGLFGK
eukprot:jgi/Chlat1/3839/Chrsp26S04063